MGKHDAFCRDVLSIKKSIPPYIDVVIAAIKDAHPYIKDYDLKNLNAVGKTPDEIVGVINALKTRLDYISSAMSGLKRFNPLVDLATHQESSEDLSLIEKEVGVIRTSYDYQSISFTRDIIMTDVYRDTSFNFGKFKIIMYPERVSVIPSGGNKKKGSYYHPYVYDEILCLGQYKEPYISLHNSMRFYAAYLLVIKCLTLYGGDESNGSINGPYSPIAEWVGQVCSVCDDTAPNETLSICSKSGRVICQKCVDTVDCTDEIDGEIYHPDVLKTCSSCSKRTSTVIRSVCLGCRQSKLVNI